jgi:UDP-2,3-diacylglucosamine pyrophosphatase LpxH
VCGNHDGPADVVSHLLGVQVKDDYIFTSGSKRVLVMHGHMFDDFIDAHPQITWFADVLYRLLQTIDRSHRFAKFAKTNSKIFLRCVQKVLDGAKSFAAEKNVDIVCCGHTHHAESSYTGAVEYHNSGCWTEMPCTYLSVAEGEVRLHTFRTEQVAAPEPIVIQPTPAIQLQF